MLVCVTVLFLFYVIYTAEIYFLRANKIITTFLMPFQILSQIVECSWDSKKMRTEVHDWVGRLADNCRSVSTYKLAQTNHNHPCFCLYNLNSAYIIDLTNFFN